MPGDFASYLAARDLVSRLGQFLLWSAVAASLWAVALPLLPRPALAGGPIRRTPTLPTFFLLAACFGLLAWFHWRIHATVPLTLPPEVGEWLNRMVAQQGGRSAAALGGVDWSHPPRFAIPLWIEGEKFFFWTLVLALVVYLEERRVGHRGYLTLLRAILLLQVAGMVLWDNPAVSPLPTFHEEISSWYGVPPEERIGQFFKLYPRMRYYYNAAYMWIHPPLLFIAYATLTATFAASVFTLGGRNLELDASAYRYARLGYLLLTFGMLVGYPWAIIAWGPNWWWDPKIASSIMMWLLYSAYLHQRFVAHVRTGRTQVALLGILCFLSLLFTYFMSWYFPGEHTF
jgi:hypothetical protein